MNDTMQYIYIIRNVVMVRCLAFFVSSLFVFFVFSHTVLAQGASGIGLKPSLIEEGADPGEVLEKEISLTNLSDTAQTYYLFKRDIVNVRDGNVPVFADPGIERTGYELTEWIEITQTEVTLEAGQEYTIPIKINVPESATPGSHFGGIFVSLEPPKYRETGASVGYEVANIVSIRISGDALESAQIRSFVTDRLVYGSTEVTFNAEVENKGNVLIRPFGRLEIYNMFGKQVHALPFNESQGGVFPLTKRAFPAVTWTDESLHFGRYQAVLSLQYGEAGRYSTISSTATFWILPMNIITPALIILAIVLLSAYFGVKLYVRRTVAVMSGGRRIVRRQRRGGGTSTLLLVVIVMLVVTALFLILLLALFA